MSLDCPCGGQTQVVDSRPRSDNALRRRRECLVCRVRFSTTEIPALELTDLRERVARLEKEKQTLINAFGILGP
jgi:transcriptional regulator NrdR family protein